MPLLFFYTNLAWRKKQKLDILYEPNIDTINPKL